MAGERALQPVASEPQQPDRALDAPYQTGDVLPLRLHVSDMCRIFRISRSQFHRQARAGKFERFELRPQIGHTAWSGVLVSRYLSGETSASRFVRVK